jgi:hypothetical protein
MFTDYRCPISAIDCRHRKQASDDFSIVGDNRGITNGQSSMFESPVTGDAQAGPWMTGGSQTGPWMTEAHRLDLQ